MKSSQEILFEGLIAIFLLTACFVSIISLFQATDVVQTIKSSTMVLATVIAINSK